MIVQTELVKKLKINSKKIAIDDGEKKVSYSQLLHFSNQITQFLLNENLEKETLVGIQLKDRSNFICSLIGVLNARCTFVPIDDSLPEKRQELIFKDLNLKYIISSKECCTNKGKNNVDGIKYFRIEDILGETNDNINNIIYPEYDKDDSIYLYFTSGSTGKPKGIVGKNCSLMQFVKWEVEQFDLDNSYKFSQFISPYFDAFLRDVFVPLFSGGTICIPPSDEDFYTADKLISWINESEISLIHCVPSVFRVFNDKSLSSEKFENLKYVLLSGEKILPTELVNWYDVFKSRIQLVNLYGTTETTMIRSYYEIKPEDVKQAKISIGTPINDTELLIYTKDFIPCNTLIPGELHIISNFATKGYINEPELTNDKFFKIKSKNLDEVIAFKTGDTARKLPNGKIDLIGREDRQIKLRGIRIEPDEIENVIVQLESINNALVVKNSEDLVNESLIAFIIKSEVSCDINIEEYLGKKLPVYMIPTNIIEVNEFPLLNNGKINIKELLNKLTPKTIIAPTNEVETKVLEIWKGILGEKLISIDESFHTLGGNSLSIMNLMGKIYKEFGVRIALSEIFNNFTIQKQAKYINESKKDSLFVIANALKKSTYNLSSAQERIYYNYLLDKDSTAYNLPMAWEINENLDNAKIEEFLKLLIDRHESLRTQFKFENDRIFQEIKDDVEFEIEEIVNKNNNIQDSILGFVRSFDLNKAPLIRCGIIKSGENKKIMVTDIHHIICDGMSQINLFGDFLKLYNDNELKPLSIQYKDYAEWENSFRMTDEYNSHREFWLKSFEGQIPKLNLPTTNSNIEYKTSGGKSVNFQISSKEIHSITDILKQDEITTFSGLLSIFYIYLFQLTGQDDIVVGINSSGRMQDELEGLVGMFVKTLPIRFKIDTNTKFIDYAKLVHEHLVKANSKQIYDLADMLSAINKNRNVPIENLFDAMFIFQNFEQSALKAGDEIFSSYEIENTTSKYPISLFASEGDELFNFRLEYSSLYFSETDVEFLITQFKSLFKDISNDMNAKIIDYFDGDIKSEQLAEDDVTFNL